METIAKYNNLILKRIDDETYESEPVIIGDEEVTYKLVDVGENIIVRRTIGDTKDTITVPKDITLLYTHVLFPKVIIIGQQNQCKQYPKIDKADKAVLAYLCFPGDVIQINRLVSYMGAGVQKTATLYQVM